ncbi:hypothetical protein [Chryseobacterium sp. MFBS3-17]|uniref:hypothetical protein n=1 Tax=Chryseobacterium sp. MFBS3-17 TaxID=2886689 RepID=UPI001D0F2E10|nr:hypothetical protein [Chryseobacterium sp. MFBS3-17]MCC2591308.1 hypothetical protein [Chryseobacterium sp. MFBS3-17]
MRIKILMLAAMIMASTNLTAQDHIILKNGTEINAKVMTIFHHEIEYVSENTPEGPRVKIAKGDVYKIRYQNGTEEIYGKYSNVEEAKEEAQRLINTYAISKSSKTVRISAVFNGHILELSPVSKRGNPAGIAEYWDLEKIIKFHKVSKRDDDIAYLNVVCTRLKNNKPAIDKMVIKMTSHKTADQLNKVLQDIGQMLN